MVMGFGCSVPAMINTRTLSDEKEKLATIRVIPFFSCGAKLPILTAVAGALLMKGSVPSVDLVTYSMYLLGVIVALVSVLIMRNTSLKGDTPPFIMELPAYHAPQFRNLMMLLYDKAKHFLQKAFTIILASTIVIWFVTHFNFSWQFLTDEQIDQSILASIGKLLQPIFTPLGFGSQLAEGGWAFIVAAISGLIAKENAVATLGTLAACVAGVSAEVGGEGAISALMTVTGIGVPALIAFIAFNMTTIPCFAAVAAAKGEMPNKKDFVNTILFWIITSVLVSSAIYTIGEFVWPVAIWAVALAGLITFVILKNKKKSKLLKD